VPKRPGSSLRRAPADLEAAIERIRTLHRLGRESLAETASGGRGKPGQARAEAERQGLYPLLLRKARRFADPQLGYTEEQLGELIGLCRRYGRAPGPVALMHLVGVPDRRLRRQLQRRLVAEGWGVRRLLAEVRGRLRRPWRGGRRPRLPDDPAALLVLLGSRAEAWVRLDSALKAAGRPEMPRGVAAPFRKVVDAARELRKALDAARRRALAGKPDGRPQRPRRAH
jgi:hypothetical protein